MCCVSQGQSDAEIMERRRMISDYAPVLSTSRQTSRSDQSGRETVVAEIQGKTPAPAADAFSPTCHFPQLQLHVIPNVESPKGLSNNPNGLWLRPILLPQGHMSLLCQTIEATMKMHV